MGHDDRLEGPDETDRDLIEDEDSDVQPCPECGREIYEGAESCPHCGMYVGTGPPTLKRPAWHWVAVGIVAFAVAFLVATC